MNLFIVYQLDTCSRDLNMNFALGDCLFGAIKLTNNIGPEKYRIIGYAIGFVARSQLPLSNSELGKNAAISAVNNNPFVHADYSKKRYLSY